ncbi:hypothetical protein ON010_g1457 [Phytophthora cinnamomi]|nr:hypothetical protein ON010_g1457 [Phytophthora cinnamomi]
MDQNCTVIVSNGESGYCEVEDIDSGERFQVMRRHCNSIRRGVPFRCSDAHEFVQFRVQAYKTARAAFEANFTLPNVAVANQPRNGIVMVVYPKLLASAYATIRVLRDVLGCQLPVEIWFRPDEMKLDGQILAPLRLLASSDSSITFQEIHDPRAKRFVAKVHAIYHSSFDRVLFLDADNVPVRDPSFLFDSPAFLRTGAIFWPDFWHPRSTIFNIHESSLLWELLGMESVDMFEQESGQLVVDRRRHAAPLELVRYFAFHRPDFFSSLRLAWGDKDLFRFAWLKLEIPFYMIQTPPAMAGSIVETAVQSEFCGMTMVQHDAEGEVLFLHRNHQKLTGKSDSTQDHDDFGSLSAALDSDRYPDPVVWTHLLRFRKGSAMKDYVVQSFSVEFTFKKKQTCFGRLDIRHSPDFYVQDVKSLAFNGLETHLRRFAMDSINLSGET